jgi:hypothetical protein
MTMQEPFRQGRHQSEHDHALRRSWMCPARGDLICVGSRRWFLQAGLAGIGGLSVGEMARARAPSGGGAASRKSVILFWLSGGPSQLDFWDPKPEAPLEIRGPFESIATRIPGARFCEHLPRLAGLADRLTVIRSVDCRASDDHRAAVMHTGNSQALKDLKITAAGLLRGRIPSMGSISARFRGANDPELPAFVGLGDPSPSLWHSDIWNAGQLGAAYEPISETDVAGRLGLPAGVGIERLQNREALRGEFDRLRRDVDVRRSMQAIDEYNGRALEMLLSGKAEKAFDLDAEPAGIREWYGRDSFGEKVLLARRLVESGVTFVVVSGRFGVFDNHGDDVVWGGLIKGLKPLLPSVDRSLGALIEDLATRGILQDTLVVAMGEFGRSPVVSATGGRTHWTNCMSVLIAGGNASGGQIIGATDARGYDIVERRVTPADLAATVFGHLQIDLAAHWTDPEGRPHPIVADGGRPLPEWS